MQQRERKETPDFFQLFAIGNLVPCIISNQKFQERRKTCGELWAAETAHKNW